MKTKVSPKEFVVQLSAMMPKLMRGMLRHEQSGAAGESVTVTQLWALGFLRETKKASVKQLASALGLKLPATSGLADRMVRNGFVKRVRSTEDRRVVLLSATAKGLRTLERILEQRAKGITALFAPLSPAERAQYLALLEKVVSRIEE